MSSSTGKVFQDEENVPSVVTEISKKKKGKKKIKVPCAFGRGQ